MTINVSYFVIAVALLWLPRPWLRRGASVWRSRRGHSAPQSWTHAPADGTTLSSAHEFSRVRNYIDLFRAAAATMTLVGSNGVGAAVSIAAGASSTTRFQVLVTWVGVLLIGLLIQLVRWERGRLSLAAPIFYLAGITLGLQEPLPGLCAFTIAWALVPVVPHTPGFLTIHALVFGVIGIFLDGFGLLTVAGVGLCLLPVLISLMSRRPLRLHTRRAASVRATVAL